MNRRVTYFQFRCSKISMFSAIAKCKEFSITLSALITIRSAVRSEVSYRIRVLITADPTEEKCVIRTGSDIMICDLI